MRNVTIFLLFTLGLFNLGYHPACHESRRGNHSAHIRHGHAVLYLPPVFNFHCAAYQNPFSFSRKATYISGCGVYFYFTIPFTLMIYGETYVSSGLASVIFSTMPVAVLDRIHFLSARKTKVITNLGPAYRAYLFVWHYSS